MQKALRIGEDAREKESRIIKRNAAKRNMYKIVTTVAARDDECHKIKRQICYIGDCRFRGQAE